jgi:tripartite ATP-independent transporter DctM subunit
MVALSGAALSGIVLAALDRALRLGLLSALARRVAFVLLPPLVLILAVLGTIFLGVATPTESGAMGSIGALGLAVSRGRFGWREAAQALLATVRLAGFVMFLFVAASVFSLSFQALDGDRWVEGLLRALPGGATGFLVFATALVFALGLFLDVYEIAVVLLPLLAPTAAALGIDLVWFGVLVGINLQTALMTPPFGYSLFYLRGVAPDRPTVDPHGGRPLPALRTADIYLGALPFVAVQIVVMALVIAFPALVLGGLDRRPVVPAEQVDRALREMADRAPRERPPDAVQRLLESLAPPR